MKSETLACLRYIVYLHFRIHGKGYIPLRPISIYPKWSGPTPGFERSFFFFFWKIGESRIRCISVCTTIKMEYLGGVSEIQWQFLWDAYPVSKYSHPISQRSISIRYTSSSKLQLLRDSLKKLRGSGITRQGNKLFTMTLPE